ncbi:MAG TPA: M3 family oligoendopeptidase [Steroidobacteraceae bacterium]|nr:M3 family oligoendopeptidase [Steroidobacteraceae bacterium]
MTRKWLLPLVLTLSAGSGMASLAQDSTPPEMWDLGDLYPNTAAWDQTLARTRAAADKIASYQGTLSKSADVMFSALDAMSAANREAARLFVYASLKSDEDVRIGANIERKQLAQALVTQLGERSAWVAPEIVKIGAAKIKTFTDANKQLKGRFGFFLDNTLRAAPHTLSPESEGVLAMTGDLLSQPGTLHNQFENGDFPAPTVTFSDGSKVRLDEQAYEKYRQVSNRGDRKLAFDQYWSTWKRFEGTAGGLLTTQVMGNHFTAEARRFPNALQAAQFPDNMPEGVYRSLVAEVNAALPALHRYLRLRKRQLGIAGEMHYYDVYPAFALRKPPSFTVAESERITLDALKPLGEDYLSLMRKGFSSHWMNAYPHEGKASGAYMNGAAYDVHPYLLLNHQNDYASLSTLAHEWGHAVHTLLTNEAQPFEKSNYSTFIAESASIGNEMLLNDYMVEHAANRSEKLYYLGQGVDSIRGTYFRQVMFAEFELAIHEELEKGKALSGERMTELYCGILKKYYGEAEGVMKIDPGYCVEWAFVPHFYLDFYVYQYATSMVGAASFTDAILKEGAPARGRFIRMLQAGGSEYPYDLYKQAGIDMATPEPYRALAARMNRLLDEIEALEKQ